MGEVRGHLAATVEEVDDLLDLVVFELGPGQVLGLEQAPRLTTGTERPVELEGTVDAPIVCGRPQDRLIFGGR